MHVWEAGSPYYAQVESRDATLIYYLQKPQSYTIIPIQSNPKSETRLLKKLSYTELQELLKIALFVDNI